MVYTNTHTHIQTHDDCSMHLCSINKYKCKLLRLEKKILWFVIWNVANCGECTTQRTQSNCNWNWGLYIKKTANQQKYPNTYPCVFFSVFFWMQYSSQKSLSNLWIFIATVIHSICHSSHRHYIHIHFVCRSILIVREKKIVFRWINRSIITIKMLVNSVVVQILWAFVPLIIISDFNRFVHGQLVNHQPYFIPGSGDMSRFSLSENTPVDSPVYQLKGKILFQPFWKKNAHWNIAHAYTLCETLKEKSILNSKPKQNMLQNNRKWYFMIVCVCVYVCVPISFPFCPLLKRIV